MKEDNDSRQNWLIASRSWASLGAPQKPSPEDVVITERAISDASRRLDRPLKALLLGVTQELAGCQWPTGTEVVAVDNTMAMIETLWPAPRAPAGSSAICADWRDLPLHDASIDIALGDGSFNAVPFEDWARLCMQLHRVLVTSGTAAIRVFLRCDQAETMTELRRLVSEGAIGSIHALKWRIAAVLQKELRDGVRLCDIWDAWQQIAAAAEPIRGRPGWRDDQVATLDRYRTSAIAYYFPTAAEFRSSVSPWFAEQRVGFGTYELAERCPTFTLERRD